MLKGTLQYNYKCCTIYEAVKQFNGITDNINPTNPSTEPNHTTVSLLYTVSGLFTSHASISRGVSDVTARILRNGRVPSPPPTRTLSHSSEVSSALYAKTDCGMFSYWSYAGTWWSKILPSSRCAVNLVGLWEVRLTEKPRAHVCAPTQSVHWKNTPGQKCTARLSGTIYIFVFFFNTL